MRLAARPVRLSSPSKYRAVKETIDGVTFASKAEARRYAELRLLERAGEIRNLRLQPQFPMHIQPIEHGLEPVFVGFYVADFGFVMAGECVETIEDVKSKPTMTRIYRLKKKIVEALYGIKIHEVK